MDWEVAYMLTVDGLSNGAVYLLAGIGLVMVFSVTRVIFVPFGDVAAFAALSLASLQAGIVPPTIGLVIVLAVVALVVELLSLARRHEWRQAPRAIACWGVAPLLPCLLAWWIVGRNDSMLLQIVAAVLLVTPIIPLIARIALQPIADASSLILLIVSLSIHFLFVGLGLLFFGPEGFRTESFTDLDIALFGNVTVSGQVALTIAVAIVLSIMFYLFFEFTLTGKALRATSVNRVGARIVGIRPVKTATLVYLFASVLAGMIGVLISPVNTIYYDSGFMLGLKAFVGAIIGGLVSYPLTMIGSLAVGIVESFSSFWNGALKEVIVFGLLIPVLMVRSVLTAHDEDNNEEIDE